MVKVPRNTTTSSCRSVVCVTRTPLINQIVIAKRIATWKRRGASSSVDFLTRHSARSYTPMTLPSPTINGATASVGGRMVLPDDHH